MKTQNTDKATAAINSAWITQPSDERDGAAMIVDSSTESYIIANELGYPQAQRICREHNEHAALVAVAEAAKLISEGDVMRLNPSFTHADTVLAYQKLMRSALANLAAVRGGAK